MEWEGGVKATKKKKKKSERHPWIHLRMKFGNVIRVKGKRPYSTLGQKTLNPPRRWGKPK